MAFILFLWHNPSPMTVFLDLCLHDFELRQCYSQAWKRDSAME